MRVRVLAAALLVAACSQTPPAAVNQAESAPLANDAGAAVAVTAAPVPAPSTSPTLVRDVGEPAVPAPGAPRPTTSLPEGPFAPDSGQAGADVVQTYVALIEEGRIDRALKLWGDNPNAPRVAAFEKYREFHANVGGPGRVEGAAGSRYVTVPVHFTGTLRNGTPFAEDGTVTLRRIGEVDGATAEQKRWRIYSVDVTPAPRR